MAAGYEREYENKSTLRRSNIAEWQFQYFGRHPDIPLHFGLYLNNYLASRYARVCAGSLTD